MTQALNPIVTAAGRDRLIRIQRTKLPGTDAGGVVTVLDQSATNVVGSRGQHMRIAAFQQEFENEYYPRDMHGLLEIPVRVAFKSTAPLGNQRDMMEGAIRAFAKRQGAYDDPVLEPYTTCEYVPDHNDLMIGASTALSIRNPREKTEPFLPGLRDGLELWKRLALDIQIDARRSFFYVADRENGAGLYCARKYTLSDDRRSELKSEEMPLHAALNFVSPQIGKWYKVPAAPFGMAPGIRGFHFQYELSQIIDSHDLVRAVALAKRHRRGVRGIKVKGDEPHYPVCDSCSKKVPLEHYSFPSREAPAVQLNSMGAIGCLMPLSGRLRVSAQVVEDGKAPRNKGYTVSPGGGILLLPQIDNHNVSVTFEAKPLERSAFAFIRSNLFSE